MWGVVHLLHNGLKRLEKGDDVSNIRFESPRQIRPKQPNESLDSSRTDNRAKNKYEVVLWKIVLNTLWMVLCRGLNDDKNGMMNYPSFIIVSFDHCITFAFVYVRTHSVPVVIVVLFLWPAPVSFVPIQTQPRFAIDTHSYSKNHHKHPRTHRICQYTPESISNISPNISQ